MDDTGRHENVEPLHRREEELLEAVVEESIGYKPDNLGGRDDQEADGHRP